MTKFHTILKFVIGHVLAGTVIILGTLLVTSVCYFVRLMTAPGGIDTPVAVIPEFLTLMLMTGVFAITVSTASFLTSILLIWLHFKWQFPIWLPVLVVPLVTGIVTFAIRGQKDLGFVVVATGLAFVYFGVYWTLLTASGAMLDFLRRKILF